MASALERIGVALQRAEAKLLLRAGFKVKNTFIDEEPEEASPSDALLRRAITSPLPQQRHTEIFDDADLEDNEREHALQSVEGDRATFAPHKFDAFECSPSEASTATCSDAGCVDSLTPPQLLRFASESSDLTESCSVCEDEEPRLASLIKHECAFLKITGWALSASTPHSSKKPSLAGVTQCLRMCVSGLPSQKRHKWQTPLAWSVACVLQRAGCPAIVKRGELFAPLGADDGGELVRVDLCSPRVAER